MSADPVIIKQPTQIHPPQFDLAIAEESHRCAEKTFWSGLHMKKNSILMEFKFRFP